MLLMNVANGEKATCIVIQGFDHIGTGEAVAVKVLAISSFFPN